MNNKFKITIFSIILFIFSIFCFLIPIHIQGQTGFENSEEGAILNAVLNENISTDSEEASSFSSLIYIWLFIGIVSLIIFIYGIIAHKISLRSFTRQNIYSSKDKVSKDALKRDQKRKEDINKIVEILTKFYEKYNRYPDAKIDEFKNLVASMKPVPKDPLANKEQQQGNTQKYGYYYDNQNDPQFYKLWCILENTKDSEAQHYYNNTLHLYVKTVQKESPDKHQENKSINNLEQNIPDESDSKIIRDVKRKEDLKTIQELLKEYFQNHNCYPNQEEYQKLILINGQKIEDPRHDEETGFNNQKFGYNYDNLKVDDQGKAMEDSLTYRIWCLLENVKDPEIMHEYDGTFHWIYMKTYLD